MAKDRIESLDYAERWLRDGLRVVDPPGGFLTVEVDMTNAAEVRRTMKEAGFPVTYTHLIVSATAAALTRHPELHRILAGNRRLFPGTVDVCLSIAGQEAVTPVLIIKDAGCKTLPQIAEEIKSRTDETRHLDEKRFAAVRKWGWLIPLGFLRRALIRFLLGRLWYRRLASGTFQVTVVPTVDIAVPFLFNTAAAIGAGRVMDRVVPVAGNVQVRPMLTLACCCDHKIWNGMDTALFLNAVKDSLEKGQFTGSL